MKSLIQYGMSAGGYNSPSNYSDNFSESPRTKVKALEGESLQEKVRILGAQISGRKSLLEKFEGEVQSRTNQLMQEKATMHHFRQDTSWVESEISKIRMKVQEEKAKAWKDIKDLEIELTEAEFQLGKRKIKNSMVYQSALPVYGSTY